MKREPGAAADLSLPAEQVELALARIEGSAAFRTSPRHRALLRHLVAKVLADEPASLKETVIAVEVFGRPVASFDPRLDSIVRVEARRLRARLSSYYEAEGRQSPIRIELPVGSYVPLIASREPPQHAPQASRRARDLVERGEHFLRQALSKPTLEQAVERFDLALRESPDYAPAYVGLGRAWLNLATGWFVEPAVGSAHAAEALRRGLELDPEDAVAHTLLGAIRHQFEHDWAGAEQSFKRGLALAPQTAFVHSAYGCHLLMHGAFEHAERELTLARQIDPQYINTRNHMVNLRLAQHRFEDAEAEVVAMQDIAPETISTVGLRAVISMFRGDATSAIARYQRLCEVHPDHPAAFIVLAGAMAMGGQGEQADALVARTLERFAGQSISPYVQAIFATRRERPDEAFALLARACTERDPLTIQTPFDPSFAGLHGDPRWAAFVAGPPFKPAC